jgi:drug/metabolite transporter (DMT)-like permease
MWIICTLLTFACWGIADLFYKLGNRKEFKYSHLITGIIVGLVMGIHANIFLLVTKTNINFIDILKYLPVSFFYISSMVIGYKGLKYLELSISSPVQNTSGVITAILLLIFFKEKYDLPFYIAVLLIFIGIFFLSYIEVQQNKHKRIEYRQRTKRSIVLTYTIIFPLVYCFLDGAGTFLDSIYLDKLSLISEDTALVAYEYTFLIYGIITYIYLKTKKVKIKIFKEKPKLYAAIFETAGQFFYVYAMSGNATISAPIVGSYCVLSLLLSRVFLKEKLSKKEYACIFLVLIGVIVLAFLDV